MKYVLIIQIIISATGERLQHVQPVDGFGPLNLQQCYEWRNAVRDRAEKYGDEIIHLDCHLVG